MSAHNLGLLMVDLALIIVLARLLGVVATRIGQPPVIGEIIGGIVLGPVVLGQHASAALFPTEVRHALVPLANLGLVLFMFSVGYHIDHRLLRQPIASSVAAGSVLLPFALGTGLAGWLATRHAHSGPALAFALFMGLAMSVTAFPVLARIVVDRGLSTTYVGNLSLSAAAVGDVAAWTLLAVVLSLGSGRPPWLMLTALPGLMLLVCVVRPLLARLLPRTSVPTAFAVVAVGMLLCAAATQLIGLHLIFGAFLFGAVCPHPASASTAGATASAAAGAASGVAGSARTPDIAPDHLWLQTEVVDRLTTVGGQLLLPAFFVTAGFDLDLGGLDLARLGELAAILAIAVGGKLAGAFAAGTLHRLPARTAGHLAVLMNARGLTEIVVLTVGLQAGILDHRLYSLMIVMALITTAMTGPLLTALRVDTAIPQGRPTAVPHGRRAA